MIIACASPAAAATPREMLVMAGFTTRDKATAITQVTQAHAGAEAILAQHPADREALMQRALSLGYLAKLHGSRRDALAARREIEALAAANPADAEAQMAIAGWHLNSISELGPMMARTALGARSATGYAALDRAVTLGGDRAMFPAMAGLMRIRNDPADMARARGLIEAGLAAPATAPIDRIMQRAGSAVLAQLKAGDGKTASELARRLLPFGRIPKK